MNKLEKSEQQLDEEIKTLGVGREETEERIETLCKIKELIN